MQSKELGLKRKNSVSTLDSFERVNSILPFNGINTVPRNLNISFDKYAMSTEYLSPVSKTGDLKICSNVEMINLLTPEESNVPPLNIYPNNFSNMNNFLHSCDMHEFYNLGNIFYLIFHRRWT